MSQCIYNSYLHKISHEVYRILYIYVENSLQSKIIKCDREEHQIATVAIKIVAQRL